MIRRYRVTRITRWAGGVPHAHPDRPRRFFTYAAAARYAERCNDGAPARVRYEVQKW